MIELSRGRVLFVAALFVGACLVADAAPAAEGLSKAVAANKVALRVVQHIERGALTHQPHQAIDMQFDLPEPGSVAVRIERHLATIGGDAHGFPPSDMGQYYYVAEPLPVREFRLGRLGAGAHELTWDGLDAEGRPVVERQAYPWKELADEQELPDGPLHRDVPVHRFRATVLVDGEEVAAANFERAAERVHASGMLPWAFRGAVAARNGGFYVADRRGWRGRRVSEQWRLERTYPTDPRGHSSDPAHPEDIQLDSAGRVYLMTGGGVFRYGADGHPAAWEADEPYTVAPYPISTRNVLGVRLQADGEPVQRVRLGAGRQQEIDAADHAVRPGFAYHWGGLAIDAADHVYLGQTQPHPEIQVFAPDGSHVRTLALKEDVHPSWLRIDRRGGLWVAGRGSIRRLNRQTGAVEVETDIHAERLHLGGDGRLYAFHQSRIYRLDSHGKPIPFDADSPYARDGGRFLDIAPPDGTLEDPDGYAQVVFGLAVDREGRLLVSAGTTHHPYRNTDRRLLRFSPEGYFVIEAVNVRIEQHRPSNVFLDDEPARFELHVDHLAGEPTELHAHWTVTDFDGRQTAGRAVLLLAPSARQALPLVVEAPEFGHYELHVRLEAGGRVVGEQAAPFARIRSRELVEDVDSPFAMCWGPNFYAMALAGVKLERVSSSSWQKMEPMPGLRLDYPEEAIQWSQAMEGWRRYAERWSVLVPEGFAYGEPWRARGPNHRIYSYDEFFRYSLDVMDRFGGQVRSYYQFWNEPNFFWHVPGEFRHEHFALVTKHTWSIAKARDKDVLAISDGDSGNLSMMQHLARHGANRYNDPIQIHYPGARPLRFDEIVVENEPEGKLHMVRELVALRDAEFPGKEVWNTEEGWWGARGKTPTVGAQVIPRIYISQIAGGVDKIFWYEMGRGHEEPTNLLGPKNLPYPAYVSYATMTRQLDGALYLGRLELEGRPLAQLHLFQRPDGNVTLAAWVIEGEADVRLDAGVDRAVRIDLMDRRAALEADRDGRLPLRLSESVQYLRFERGALARRVAGEELDCRLAELEIDGLDALPGAIRQTAPRAAKDGAAMNRLYYLVRAAEQAALAGRDLGVIDADDPAGAAAGHARCARTAIERREGEPGYLRDARTALRWAERLARYTDRHRGDVARSLAHAAALAADAAIAVAEQETVDYPGLVINAYLEPTAVRKDHDPAEPLDENFRFEITRRPGETIEMELTVWNYYRADVAGTARPRVPEGWRIRGRDRLDYDLRGGTFARDVFDVVIPDDAEPGLYELGGTTTYRSQPLREIHPQRVRVQE